MSTIDWSRRGCRAASVCMKLSSTSRKRKETALRMGWGCDLSNFSIGTFRPAG